MTSRDYLCDLVVYEPLTMKTGNIGGTAKAIKGLTRLGRKTLTASGMMFDPCQTLCPRRISLVLAST